MLLKDAQNAVSENVGTAIAGAGDAESDDGVSGLIMRDKAADGVVLINCTTCRTTSGQTRERNSLATRILISYRVRRGRGEEERILTTRFRSPSTRRLPR